MNVREATAADTASIRSIARESLASSYTDFLPAETIDDAVSNWYGEEFSDEIASDTSLCLVATLDEDVVAFSQSELLAGGRDTGQILWLHVHPEARGSGVGVRLLVRTREELLDASADVIRALVLAENERGNEFYATHGFDRAGTRTVDIGDEQYEEAVFVASGLGETEQWRTLESLSTDEEAYVSYGEAARGSKAPFYAVYSDEEGEERYGWYCGSCDSVATAMDAMGRIECTNCANRRKATRWDAAYL